MSTLTLLNIINRAAYAAAEVVGPDKRHTPEMMLQLVNDSLQRYHALKNQAGHPHDVTRALLTTSASATVTLGWPLNSYVTLPSDFLALLGCNRLVSAAGQSSTPLRPFTEWETQLVWDPFSQLTGPPEAYRIAQDTEGNKILRLLPAADAVYSIEVIYLPALARLNREDSFTFHDGTEFAVIGDVAMQMLESVDLVGGGQYQAIAQRRNEALSVLQQFAKRQARTGVETPINDRRMRRMRREAEFRIRGY